MSLVMFPIVPSSLFYGNVAKGKPVNAGILYITGNSVSSSVSRKALLIFHQQMAKKYPGAEAISLLELAEAWERAKIKTEKYAEDYKISRPKADFKFHVFCEVLDWRHQHPADFSKMDFSHLASFVEAVEDKRSPSQAIAIETLLKSEQSPDYEELQKKLHEIYPRSEALYVVQKLCKKLKTPVAVVASADIYRLKQQLLLMYKTHALRHGTVFTALG